LAGTLPSSTTADAQTMCSFYAGGVTVHPMTFRSPLERERHVVEYQVRQAARGADVALRTDGPVNIEALRTRGVGSGLKLPGKRPLVRD
jgi:hypothetical protein